MLVPQSVPKRSVDAIAPQCRLQFGLNELPKLDVIKLVEQHLGYGFQKNMFGSIVKKMITFCIGHLPHPFRGFFI